jgi:hypothetical protein
LDVGDRRLLTVGPFELTGAEARAIAARSPQSPSIRTVVDAMRRDRAALPDPMAAVRRAARADAASPLSLKQISAAFTAMPPPLRLSCKSLPTKPRLSAADLDLMFPLRQISKNRGFPVLAPSRCAGESGASRFDANAAREDLAERANQDIDDTLSAAARLVGAAGDFIVGAPPGDKRLDELAGRLGWAVIATIRAGGALPANPCTDAEGDKLVPIGIAAQILGLTKNAVAKRARKMGFVELVGGRVHIRRRLIDKLYEKPAALASAQA